MSYVSENMRNRFLVEFYVRNSILSQNGKIGRLFCLAFFFIKNYDFPDFLKILEKCLTNGEGSSKWREYLPPSTMGIFSLDSVLLFQKAILGSG